jgi:hypothetical protein
MSEAEAAHNGTEVTTGIDASKAGQGWGHAHGKENPRFHYQPDLSDAGS